MSVWDAPAQTESEIRTEEWQLRKADAGILAGRTRLRNQDRLLAHLAECGAASAQAERLGALRHRALIEQRIAYLEERRMRERRG